MPSKTQRTKTQLGLGWQHQKRRAALMARHRDGAPCPCFPEDACGPACPCRKAGHGLPMYREPGRNPDGMALEADHSVARALGGKHADRLMLAVCNRSRGIGVRKQAEAPMQLHTTRDWLGEV